MSFTNKLSVLKIVEDTLVDGPGFRTSIYAAGCIHECVGCHNPASWVHRNGTFMEIDRILEVVKNNFLAQVSFSGGDPLCQPQAFTTLAKKIKQETGKNIWCYTGFTFEKIKRTPTLEPILYYLDVLVDGRFIEKKKDTTLLFRGSSNQRIIEVQKSLRQGRVILWESALPNL
ncbi:anaerobic ribonucleoside-triphosphate reductase activating protein [Elizabethkingia argentiflava]|uniref:Anaerobic ribonucleoside-triphosphate reductase-activating protein n=1 Tax=Elizabethkingia argenteiflava TaxID=2681556 RepID=A0A845Q0Q1_9FLAO|nr:anaerobic ribonucleoside-triphosphate reductase activating protein [Elizabethkingia argenteiflava]NAW51890.1 anaerobic ribonucleoside-triphosphate reductase activating protein [Elizabethkingia argenteiflava]